MRCRVCACLCKKKYTHTTTKVTGKASHPRDLKAAFGIDVLQDKPSVHPTGFCNNCYLKMKQKLKHDSNTSLVVFNWQPHDTHTDTGTCVQCHHFQEEQAGGRPKSATKNRGRPKSTKSDNPLDELSRSTCSSWNAPQVLTPSSFLLPSTGLQINDVQCPFCSLVVDRPVQAACGQLVCCRCIIEYMQHNDLESFPCCHGGHATLPIPAADMVIKVVGSLLIHCSTCQMAVELRQLRHHFDSGCQTTGDQQQSQSQQTVDQILSRPLDAPPTTTEKKLATSVIRRMINSSSTSEPTTALAASSSLVTLPTGGQVSDMHTQNY